MFMHTAQNSQGRSDLPPSKRPKSDATGASRPLCAAAAILTKRSISDAALTLFGKRPYWDSSKLAAELLANKGSEQDPVEDFETKVEALPPATSDNTRQNFNRLTKKSWTVSGLKVDDLLALRDGLSNETFFAQHDFMAEPHYSIIKNSLIATIGETNYSYVSPQIFALYWLRALAKVP